MNYARHYRSSAPTASSYMTDGYCPFPRIRSSKLSPVLSRAPRILEPDIANTTRMRVMERRYGTTVKVRTTTPYGRQVNVLTMMHYSLTNWWGISTTSRSDNMGQAVAAQRVVSRHPGCFLRCSTSYLRCTRIFSLTISAIMVRQ